MKVLPDTVAPNRDYDELRVSRAVQLLNRDVHDRIIQRGTDYSEPFFFEEMKWWEMAPENSRNDVITVVVERLRELGWRVELVFGDTTMFVFVGDVPPNCYIAC